MRIAIVGTELCAVDARGGGLEQVLRRWASALAREHDVFVISHGTPVPSGEPYGVIRVRRPAELAAALAALAPDVVSLHNRPQWTAMCPPRVRAGVTFHNYPAAWKMRRPPPQLPGLSAVSAALAHAVAAHLGVADGDVTVVPPSIDPAFGASGRWEPEPVVLSPNRLMRKKGVRELLDVAGTPAFASVRFEFADLISPWTLPTAEHRALRAAIRAVPNAGVFDPAPGPAALAARICRAGVVVCFATEPEGLGLVALEAQACGVPLVTSQTGGLPEATLPPNRSVPLGDPDALADALRSALDGVERRALAAARRAVLQRYAPERSGAAFGRWLRSLPPAG